MLTLRAIKAILLSILLLAGAAFAEQKYVTDLKYVNLYSKPNKNSETLMYLPSGSKIKVVYEGQHFAKVTTTDGVTGWVSTGHIDPGKPQRVQHNDTKIELEQLKLQLKKARKDHAEQKKLLEGDLRRVMSAKSGSVALRSCPKVKKQECPTLPSKASNHKGSDAEKGTATEDVPAQKASIVSTLTNPIVLGVVGGVFLLSFLLGWLFFDWRRRRRYGGFRI